ncbi:ATP-binding protein [Nonomuraea sp. NPDC046570]|uniref:AAA family ATPase n=1 Tax=Nonomuraea sp. NPDC046570 TaxID=3155255 RepID=UPI0033F74847
MTNGPVALHGFGLLPALRRLDALLTHALELAADVYGPGAADDPYRGLVIGADEVTRLVRRQPGEPLFPPDDPPPDLDHGAVLNRLTQAFDLTPFDLDLLVVATAPELDLRYERLYAYLQDDVTKRRPTVDLALNLLCASAAERIEARRRVAADAPLVRHGLLHLIADPAQPYQPLLGRVMRVDEQILHLLIGQPTLDSRITPCARLARPRGGLASVPLEAVTRQALPPRDAGPGSPPLRLYFAGPPDAGQRGAAEALAAERGLALLTVDLELAAGAPTPLDEVLRVAFREAWIQDCAIFVTGVDAIRGERAYERLLHEVSGAGPPTMLAGRQPWAGDGREGGPLGVVVVPFPAPSAETRGHWWRRELAAAGIGVDDHLVENLATRYRLTATRIAEAVATVPRRAPQPAELFAAARAQSGHELAALARKSEPVHSWDSLILPEDTLAQLRELRDRVAQRRRVLGEWGFGRALALGRGICALFVGSSGTGKTMAAGVVAAEIGLDLYQIDLATVVSKYIGETEKNLERVFTAAESANAVLFFDEADAIFGKRSEVRDAHDRYANLEIAYLLQRMEQYDGIAILATNLRENLDDAFLRRLHFVVEFPMPTESYRERMWRGFLPPEAPVEEDIDHAFLARQFRLSGGNIKNIVLASAYLACADGGRIGMTHLVRAAWREHQKIGRVLSAGDIGEYAGHLAGWAGEDRR